MQETLHSPSLDGLTELDAPCYVPSVYIKRSEAKSPMVYGIPAASLLTAACGGGGSSSPTAAPPPPPPPTAQVAKPSTEAEAARFILRSSLSVSDAEITNIRSVGYDAWLNAQIDAPISQSGVAWLSARGYSQITIDEFYFQDYPGDYMIWSQLMSDANAVRKRAALALSEFFVVSLSGLDIQWRSQAIAYYWDQLNSNAFGSFRKLLEDITLNPAMGHYLSTLGNKKEDAGLGRLPDENFAREVMQLFTIGLFQLNNDGSRKLDGNNQPIETYTNADVTNLARAFTGFNTDWTGNGRTPSVRFPDFQVDGISPTLKPMTNDPTKWVWPQTTSEHSSLEATFLGTTIPANTDGTTALKTALDTLFNHANVAPFFAKQMIQRLVTSNPSAGFVDRVARVFNDNGASVRGDLRAVFKAILFDDEAMSAAGLTTPTFGKMREPALRFVQWARTFGTTSASGNWKIGNLSDLSSGLGQSPLRSPSVFNFFRPGYVPANTAIASNALVAPEFQLVNEVSTAGYVNYMSSAIGSANGVGGDVKAAYTSELAIAHDSVGLLNRICRLMAANQISEATKTTIRTALDAAPVTETSSAAEKQRRVYLAVLLVMASPDYLVQK